MKRSKVNQKQDPPPPQRVKARRRVPEASGRSEMFICRITVTRNGKTTVIADTHIERRLVNGQWVDVKRKELGDGNG
jgi:hypothetical protein